MTLLRVSFPALAGVAPAESLTTVYSPNAPQALAQPRAEKDRERFGLMVDCQSCVAAKYAARLSHATELDSRILSEAIGVWCSRHQLRDGTKYQTAIHEAGHFVACEAVGLGAALATIKGSSFGRYGWSGSAHSYRNPIFDGPKDRVIYTADDVRAEAVATLAGPAAEHVLAGGDLYSSPGEVIATCLLAARLAQMERIDLKDAVLEVLTRTAKLIHGYSATIEAVAGLLERRRRIASSRKGVVKLLNVVCAVPPEALPQPAEGQVEELLQLFVRAPIKLGALVARVVK